MKPNFALSLSFEGIRLLYRAAGGWREVGEVSVTSDMLGEELAVLRKTAASLAPEGVRSKLLIPASQIRYLTLDTPDLTEPERRKAAEAALENATPYAVSDLVYDISMDGPRTHVAAVARETLAEAEAFASEHRFHPVSFVAVPGDAPYLGEPFFGVTQAARDLLGPDEGVEPDGIAVVVVGSVTAAPQLTAPVTAQQATAPVDEKGLRPEPAQDRRVESPVERPTKAAIGADTVPAAAPARDDVPADVRAEAREDARAEVRAEAPQAAARTQANQQASADPQSAPSALQLPPASGAEEPAKTPAGVPTPPAEPASPQPRPPLHSPPRTSQPLTSRPQDAAAAAPRLGPAAEPGAATPRGGTAAPVPAAGAGLPFAPKAPVTQDSPAPAVPSPLATPGGTAPVQQHSGSGFATRRGPLEPGARALGGALGGAMRTADTPGAPKPAGAKAPDVLLRPDSRSLTDRTPAMAAASAAPPEAPVAVPQTTPESAARSGFLSRRKPAAAGAAVQAKPAGAVQAKPAAAAQKAAAFGARTDEIGGKPRFLGLVMTVILLVFLAGVAAWAAVFLDDGIAGLMRKNETRITASAPENQTAPEIIRAPESIGGDGVTPEEAATSENVQSAALDPVVSAQDTSPLRAAPPAPQTPDITEAEAAARYAVSGIWPLAPDAQLAPPQIRADPVYHSGIDPVSSASDAIALTAPVSFDTDIQMAALGTPPPFGQQIERGQDGRIVPTAAGVVTPDGFTLFAASPPLKPPATLARFTPQPAVTAPATASPLAGIRPQNRPEDLPEAAERAQLGGVSRVELAAFRPSLRPASLQDRAQAQEEAQRQASEAAEQAEAASQSERAAAAAQAATAAATAALVVPRPTVGTAVIPDASRFATAQSARPDVRPRNFDRIVRRATSAAPRDEVAPAEETRVAAAASVAPRSVAPSLPSSASAARSATVENAINLRRLNLIGVYGKPASRSALIRLPNGRYQKVNVGDRLDGGRVSAIGNAELRYTKGGRNLVLQMP